MCDIFAKDAGVRVSSEFLIKRVIEGVDYEDLLSDSLSFDNSLPWCRVTKGLSCRFVW